MTTPSPDTHSYLQAEITRVAETQELEDRGRALLVWFFENVWSIDDLDAYEYIADQSTDTEIDAVFPEPAQTEEIGPRLNLLEVKATTELDAEGLSRQIANLPGPDEIRGQSGEGSIPGVAVRYSRHSSIAKLIRGDFEVRYVLVTDALVTDPVDDIVRSAAREAQIAVDIFDRARLEPIARGMSATRARHRYSTTRL